MPQEQFPMQHCGHGVHQPSNPYPVSNHHTSSISSINSNVDSLAADTQSPSDSLNFPIPGMVISDVKNWHDVVQQYFTLPLLVQRTLSDFRQTLPFPMDSADSLLEVRRSLLEVRRSLLDMTGFRC